ncbi:MAG: electron transport complex subunit RsxC [Gammaproteobacteria bacterium]|nr:electron transport complex subunit RsxC [Gammaproteobacteria bacterium]
MTAATFDLGQLHGGLRLPDNKQSSTAMAVQTVPVPAQLVIPITQHAGDPAHPIVGIGERVLKGQLIAESDGYISAPVHASSSGKIVAIEPWPVSRRLGDKAPCVIIECDGEDRAIELSEPLQPYDAMPPEVLFQRILHGGIVGLGGAVFPTAQKLMHAASTPLELLILNGVECEPYISCDDMLMREYADEMLKGAQILMHALGVDRCFIAVESDKPDAISKISEAGLNLHDDRIVLKQIPTIYPSGAEDQLVQLVSNREVPSEGLPTDVGCVVQNVGTAAAVARWIDQGEPLISRITTVTGDGVMAPMNVNARIGTTVGDIVNFVGGYSENARHLIIGGPMTGKSVSTDDVPLVKATNCILVLSNAEPKGETKPCIRCGECAAVCPIQLLPQQLYWYTCADDERQLRNYGLTDCIECGCCDLVCPSHIPLTADFRMAKARMREMEDERARAERARQRFEARNERLDKELQERAAELAEQKRSVLEAGSKAIQDILARTGAFEKRDDDNKKDDKG